METLFEDGRLPDPKVRESQMFYALGNVDLEISEAYVCTFWDMGSGEERQVTIGKEDSELEIHKPDLLFPAGVALWFKQKVVVGEGALPSEAITTDRYYIIQ